MPVFTGQTSHECKMHRQPGTDVSNDIPNTSASAPQTEHALAVYNEIDMNSDRNDKNISVDTGTVIKH